MTRLLSTVFLVALFTLALLQLACGNSSPRTLLSATVTPAAATASNSPNGIVQFTATGEFDRPPSPAAITSPIWFVEPSAAYPADAASISSGGAARCKAGFVGTVTIHGGGEVCPVNPKMGIPCQRVVGTARLTCP